MAMRMISLNLDKKTYEDLMTVMRMTLEDDEGICIHRMFEGSSKQEWYRQVLRAGLKTKMAEFDKIKKEGNQ